MAAEGIRRRCPAFVAALALALGIVVSDRWPQPVWFWAGLAATAWLVALGAHRRGRRGGATWWLLVAVLAAGALRHHQHTRLLPPHHISRAGVFGLRGELTAWLAEAPERRADGSRRVRLRLESLRPEDGGAPVPLRGDLLLRIGAEVTGWDAGLGDRVRLRCRVRQPQPARNPGAFDSRRFLALRHGIHATASIYRDADVIAVESHFGPWWQERLVQPLRGSVRHSLTAHLQGAPAALLAGMLLGDKHAIPAEVSERFRSTGLAHTLVISGLHVGLVTLFLLTLLRVLRCPEGAACVITVGLLGIYALITDLQAPVVRSTVMAAVLLLGRALERQGSIVNSLGLAALLLMVAQPTGVLTLSFQLSFAATLAIVCLYQPLIQLGAPLLRLGPEHWREESSLPFRWVLAPACVSLAAQLGTAPLMLHHFGQLAPLALLANLLVVPLLGLAVAQGLLTALVAPWWPQLGLLISAASWVTLQGLLFLVEAFAAIAPVRLAQPSAAAAGVAMALIAVVTLAIYLPRLRFVSVVAVLLSANLWVWPRLFTAPVLEVVFLDVGQGDGTFLRFPDGKTMIVDAGLRSRRIDFGERVALPFLRRRGVERLDIVIASHAHADHIGGLVHLLEQIEVGHFIDAGQRYDSWTSARLHALIEARGIRYHTVRAGDSLAGLGGVGGLVLHPTPVFVDSAGRSQRGLNNGSVVVRFDYGGQRLLFTGDIEQETDAALIAWGERLRAEVLKVAHHGSGTSSSPAFVAAVAPQWALVSVGAFNKFRHPSAQVIERLAAVARVARTDQCGAVALRIDGQGAVSVQAQLPCTGAEGIASAPSP